MFGKVLSFEFTWKAVIGFRISFVLTAHCLPCLNYFTTKSVFIMQDKDEGCKCQVVDVS